MPPTFINPFADAIEPRFRTQPVPDFRPQTPLRTSRRKRFTEAIISGFQITSDADRERASAEAAREAENIRSRAAPKTLLKNQRIKECWIDYIHVFRLENQPRLRDDEVWQPELVETQMFGFLTTMVKYTPPRKGFDTLHATTLLSWYNTFIRLIVENMQVDGKSYGFTFLRDKDRISKLKDKVQQLIFDKKLSRITKPKFGFSRHEIKILLTTILDASNHSSTQRMFAFQSIFAITVAFCGALRPSSLAAANALAIEQDQYLHIGDCQLFVHGPLDWEIRIHVTNFKGSFGITASEQYHRYRSLKMGHNLLFDPTVWAVLNWFSRGVFLKKYKDFAEFCNDNSAEIQFDPNKKSEPALLAGLPGQNGKFSDKPMTSSNLTEIFAAWCEKALLPRCGFGAMRRFKADMWGMQLGFELAQVLMNHARGGVYHNAYTKKNENYDLPALAMGEIAGSLEKAPGEVIKRMEDQQMFIGVAVECLVRTTQDTDKGKTKAERAEVVEDHPDIIAHNQLVDNAFTELLECLTPLTSIPSKLATRSVNALMNKVLNEPEDSDCPRIVPGKEIRCHVIHARLLDLFRRGYRIKANINRLIKDGEAQEITHAIKYGSCTGTVEDRHEAIKQSHALDCRVFEVGVKSLSTLVITLVSWTQCAFF
ncbi:hypothetical protein HYPSUDRAFT_1032153 [Hypholoma sublateritium FD-334 SS-4]|uniref:Uncharacterized protein n=1 Tax=Hypholoma sublateritium (strain FD-334 SS-4) TaxID=945553 RepID=A0A0D2Q5I3_HYPSF|nr:hypothetical protein HYPSUDRAFT_1032153 [Hypholoma sublateritium FD-334 SS-4]